MTNVPASTPDVPSGGVCREGSQLLPPGLYMGTTDLERVLERPRTGRSPHGLGAADGADGRTEVFTATRSSSPMPIDPAKAVAAEPRSAEISWDHKDVQLYHLGLGAGTPATDPDELRYTLESRLHVLPSFATVAGAGMGVVGGLSAPASTSTSPPSCTAARRSPCTAPSPSPAAPSPPPASPPSTTRARPPSSSCAPRPPTPTARSGPATPRSSSAEKAAGAATAAPPSASRSPSARPTPPSNGRSARNRPCSTGSPETGTRSTPTPSSPSSPTSTGRSCTGSARTA